MFELMRFYLAGRGWRARLALNPAAASIYTCWRMAAILLLGAALGVVLQADAATCALLALGGVLAFAFSFAFLRDAKRVHALRRW
ncbi:MAG TPA: hypothetical protein VFB01_16310 [Burkholderiales bacterium]|nr:hypothetical protein [Burkholderiales bacterium]